MGMRIRIEIFGQEDSADVTMEVVDRYATRVERLGELIGYAVNATESVVVHTGDSIIHGMLETLNDRFSRAVEA